MEDHTSARIASAAAKVLGMTPRAMVIFAYDHPEMLRAIAGSALRQSPDHILPVDTGPGDRDPSGGENPGDF